MSGALPTSAIQPITAQAVGVRWRAVPASKRQRLRFGWVPDPLLRPPEGWPQRAGRILPFPPGDGGDAWELVIDRRPGEHGWSRYHLRSTGEVYREEGERYYQPTWGDLPLIVRRRIHDLASGLR